VSGYRAFGILGPLLVLLAAFAAASSARADDAALCEQAILHGAREVGVPVQVLHAIALTETGRQSNGRFSPWPWAVNREGQGYWFRTREEALAFAHRSVAERRPSFDMSCFQINYHWHGHNFPSLEAMVDPKTAAVYAARFLRDLYHELGTWSAAAGAYHSRTPEFANRYRARFDRILAGLGGTRLEPGGFVAATAPPLEAAPAEPPKPVPVRMIAAPKIITVAPAGAAGVQPPRGVVVVTVEELVAPLPAGRRL
jgi:hypothetical protein